jgi:hypothetical protein
MMVRGQVSGANFSRAATPVDSALTFHLGPLTGESISSRLRRDDDADRDCHSRTGLEMNKAVLPDFQNALEQKSYGQACLADSGHASNISSRLTRKGGGFNSKRRNWGLPLRGGRAANDRPGPRMDNVALLLPQRLRSEQPFSATPRSQGSRLLLKTYWTVIKQTRRLELSFFNVCGPG